MSHSHLFPDCFPGKLANWLPLRPPAGGAVPEAESQV